MQKTSSKKFSAFLLLPLLAGICWGSTGSFVRVLSGLELDNATLLFTRTFPALIIMFFIILIYDRKLFRIRIKEIWIFILCGIPGMLGLNLCYNFAIVRLSLSFAAVLLSMSPIFVLFLAAALFHEKITRRKVFCIILALIGCILVSGLAGSIGTSALSAIGILVGICSAFFYGLYSIFLKTAVNHGYHSLTITFYSLIFITIGALPLANLSDYAGFLRSAPFAHGGIMLATAFLNAVLPYILFNVGMARAEAGIASILAAAGEPAAAMVFGLLFFSEIPTVLMAAGLILTIIALALLLRSPSASSSDLQTDPS